MRLRELKGLCPLPDQARLTGFGLGESFEIAACDEDEEARAHPSRLRFEDGSELSLPVLLARHAGTLLGPAWVRRHGANFPLLPKLLDVKELLSVQGHPEGHTEVYVIIDAEPGATMRLGFNRDLDSAALKAELEGGRERQRRLLELLAPGMEPQTVQELLQPWFADRRAGLGAVPDGLRARCRPDAAGEVEALLEQLKTLYWRVLDAMNALPVAAGDVVYNANPARIAAERPPSAEVHALGNPEGREILALEIRRPGPTFRAWDNVRFPVRPVDVAGAVAALNLRRTLPAEFRVEPVSVPGRAGVFRSVVTPSFVLEHLRPTAAPVAVPVEAPHCLHVLCGRIELETAAGVSLGLLECGESAIVPIGVGGYRVSRTGPGEVEVVKVGLPADAGAAAPGGRT